METFKSVIYLLVLIGSSYSRVATRDEPLPDINTNTITEDVKNINVTEIRIDLPTIQPDVTNATENSTVTSTATPVVKTKCTGELSDNTIDGNPDEELCGYDIEPALILTEFIKENRLQEARNASRVNADLFLNVESYSGYFTVNETHDSNVFFWYFPVEKKAVEKTPWIVWLQGGPGATSMTGLFDEIGPFRYTIANGLARNPFTWHQNHSLLFIDNPVGTGFSFTNSEDGYARDMDTYGSHLYSVLHQFLIVFPELRAAPLFVAGESYGGKYVPALASQLHRHKAAGDEDVNLQGVIVGNGYVSPSMLRRLERPFYELGLLAAEQVALLRPLIQSFQADVDENRGALAKDKWSALITSMLMLTNQHHIYNFLRDELPVGRYIGYLKEPHIRQALHVGSHKCSYLNTTVNKKLDGDFLSSAQGLYEELLQHYRVLTYCGQLDLMLPCGMSAEHYRTWQWGGAQEFRAATRHPFRFHGKLAGYHKTGGNLTEVVVRGAGHMAPMDAPPQTQALITMWTHQIDLGHSGVHIEFFLEYVQNHTKINDIGHYL